MVAPLRSYAPIHGCEARLRCVCGSDQPTAQKVVGERGTTHLNTKGLSRFANRERTLAFIVWMYVWKTAHSWSLASSIFFCRRSVFALAARTRFSRYSHRFFCLFASLVTSVSAKRVLSKSVAQRSAFLFNLACSTCKFLILLS